MSRLEFTYLAVQDLDAIHVYKYASDGRLLQSWGVRDTPGDDASHFNQPADVAFAPDGDRYIADGYGNARVVHLDANGKTEPRRSEYYSLRRA